MTPTTSARAIFISYRRDDAGGEAGRLFDDLTRAFDSSTVFMDVAGIEPGIDFRKAIDDNVASCGVLLAVIGPQWLAIADPDGARRLESSNDFVRLEIASALSRNIPVIPVLVHSASMPHADKLPDDLKDLAYRNAVELTLPRWNSDVALLVTALKNYVHATPATAAATVHATIPVQLPAPESPAINRTIRKKTPLLLGIGALAFILIAAAIYFLTRSATEEHGSHATAEFQVPLPFNDTAYYSDGTTFPSDGGIDGQGNALDWFDTDQPTFKYQGGLVYAVGRRNQPNVVRGTPGRPLVIPTPPLSYSSISILATSSPGPQLAEFVATYAGHSPNTQIIPQNMSDWRMAEGSGFSNERPWFSRQKINRSDGTSIPARAIVYQYTIKLDHSRNLKSLQFPPNPHIFIFAVTLRP